MPPDPHRLSCLWQLPVWFYTHHSYIPLSLTTFTFALTPLYYVYAHALITKGLLRPFQGVETALPTKQMLIQHHLCPPWQVLTVHF